MPAGEFLMGSPPTTSPAQLQKLFGNDVGWYQGEFPQHRVRISKPFWLGKTEVAQAQWQALVGDNPSKFLGRPQNPVEQEELSSARRGSVGIRLPRRCRHRVLLRRRCGELQRLRVVASERWRLHAVSGAEEAQCLGPPRHGGQRLGVVRGLV